MSKPRITFWDILRIADEVIRPIFEEVLRFDEPGDRLRVTFVIRKTGKRIRDIKLDKPPVKVEVIDQ
ncbi:MAG: hypothetical protein A2Y78_06735 [Acidobacteria bacterium RBG_13_68_16]|nr:MAG: hypothetical protein A2Y78_06735 [Acidobacteria bacterium RBG_13_68_16]